MKKFVSIIAILLMLSLAACSNQDKMCIRDRYERLSRDDFGKDDDQQRESNSISNQKAMTR